MKGTLAFTPFAMKKYVVLLEIAICGSDWWVPMVKE
jgi:hypothetical protein